jgi:hypothetical protein
MIRPPDRPYIFFRDGLWRLAVYSRSLGIWIWNDSKGWSSVREIPA